MPIFYSFQDITIYWWKICIVSPFLPTTFSFEALTRGVPLRARIWKLVSKTYSHWATQRWKLHDRTIVSVAVLRACDRQTDRHAAYAYIAL